MVDWSNPEEMVSVYFKVKDCLWLPKWDRLAAMIDGLDDTIKENLIKTCQKLDVVEVILGEPILVHSFYRPPEYNALVGGAKNSYHTRGMACDFSCPTMKIESIKEILSPLLDGLELRMEKDTTTWVHIDRGTVGPSGRYFNA